jgi:hypothetical protein
VLVGVEPGVAVQHQLVADKLQRRIGWERIVEETLVRRRQFCR